VSNKRLHSALSIACSDGTYPCSYPGPKQSEDLRIKFASENQIASAAKVWHEGLTQEEGSLWMSYLNKWTPASAAKWFLDSQKRLARESVGR